MVVGGFLRKWVDNIHLGILCLFNEIVHDRKSEFLMGFCSIVGGKKRKRQT